MKSTNLSFVNFRSIEKRSFWGKIISKNVKNDVISGKENVFFDHIRQILEYLTVKWPLWVSTCSIFYISSTNKN